VFSAKALKTGGGGRNLNPCRLPKLQAVSLGKNMNGCSIRQLKNTRLLRCAHPSSLRRTIQYASFLRISRALHLNVFDQPVKKHFSTTG